jgi:hypothetical protein
VDPGKTEGRSKAFVVVLALFCAAVLAPTIAYRVGVDQGVFAYLGAEILEGRWPYLQTWESDFPGLMFIQAGIIATLGESLVMFRVVDWVVQLTTALLIYGIAQRAGCHRAGALLAAGIYCLTYQGYGPWNTAQREGFGMFFVLLGFWLFLTAQRRPPWLTSALIGLGFGVAVLTKPTLVVLAVFYAPLLPGLRTIRAFQLFVAAALSAAAPTALLLLFYWSQGGLLQIYEACIAYQSIYTARLRGDSSLWSYWLGKAANLGREATWLGILYLPFLIGGRERRVRTMIYAAYIASIYSVWVQGTFAGYHYLPGLAIGAVLLGSMYTRIADIVLAVTRVPSALQRIPLRECVAAAVLLAAIPVYVRAETVTRFLDFGFLDRPRPNEFRNGTVFDYTEDYDVAEYLRTRTEPNDYIQVWGYESLVYYLADRNAASRFQMTHPLVMREPGEPITPMQQRWRDEFIGAMHLNRPRYVAVVRDDNWWWAPEERTSEQLLDDFPEWKAFIQKHYQLEHTIGRFLIYRWSSDTSLRTNP